MKPNFVSLPVELAWIKAKKQKKDFAKNLTGQR